MIRVLLFFSTIHVGWCGPVVNTSYGELEGIALVTDAVSLDAFLGIPFSKPLTPNDRMKQAVRPTAWSGRRPATSFGSECWPNSVSTTANLTNFSEDCLYLNVFTPTNKTGALLPVLVFVHGGSFAFGSSVEPDDFPLAQRFCSRDVIVVTIQYRLAAFGFLASKDRSIESNIGMYDQKLALQYIQENIKAFGGDKSRVTVMGHSSGAWAVGILSVSPDSRDLFQYAIELSGGPWGFDSFKQTTRESTKYLFDHIGCANTSDPAACLRAAPLESIISAQNNLMFWPVTGRPFIPKSMTKLLKDTKPRPVMAGLHTLEALFFGFLFEDPAVFPSINQDYVLNYINETAALYGNKSKKAFRRMKNYFVPLANESYPYYMRQFTKIQSNILIDIGSLREARERVHRSSVYYYHFEYFNPAQFAEDFPVKATYHCHEFPYLFGLFLDRQFTFTADDYKVEKFLLDSISTFVKSGNPSTSSFTWPPSDQQLTHVKIQPTPTVDTELFESDYQFWEQMKQLGYDAITQSPPKRRNK